MTWNCCTPTGECQRGHGCPAGVLCTQSPSCTDTACPGHPGVAARSMPPRVDLSRVQLIGQQNATASKRHGLRAVLVAVIRGLSIGLALASLALLVATCTMLPTPKTVHPTKVVTT